MYCEQLQHTAILSAHKLHHAAPVSTACLPPARSTRTSQTPATTLDPYLPTTAVLRVSTTSSVNVQTPTSTPPSPLHANMYTARPPAPMHKHWTPDAQPATAQHPVWPRRRPSSPRAPACRRPARHYSSSSGRCVPGKEECAVYVEDLPVLVHLLAASPPNWNNAIIPVLLGDAYLARKSVLCNNLLTNYE